MKHFYPNSLPTSQLLRGLLLALALCAVSFASSDEPAEFVILANKNNPLTEIGKSDLARLYLSKSKKIDGQAYRVVNLAEEEIKNEFLGDLTSMSEDQLEKHYIALELRGEGSKPREVKSSRGMIFLLIKSDTIIGWLPVDEYNTLSEDVREHMRVIRLK